MIQNNKAIIILGVCMLALSQAISIPVTSQKERCMIVYTTDAEEFLKVDIKFTKFQGQTDQDGYRVILFNTETRDEQAFQIVSGAFKKQFKLDENIVYKICMKIVTTRDDNVQQIVEYHAGTKHITTFENLKIPDNLLKVADLKKTYVEIVGIEENLIDMKKHYKERKLEDELTFKTNDDVIAKVKIISMIELAAICVFGLYQFYVVQSYLKQKQYI